MSKFEPTGANLRRCEQAVFWFEDGSCLACGRARGQICDVQADRRAVFERRRRAAQSERHAEFINGDAFPAWEGSWLG